MRDTGTVIGTSNVTGTGTVNDTDKDTGTGTGSVTGRSKVTGTSTGRVTGRSLVTNTGRVTDSLTQAQGGRHINSHRYKLSKRHRHGNRHLK